MYSWMYKHQTLSDREIKKKSADRLALGAALQMAVPVLSIN
jgi:hypothetical protein